MKAFISYARADAEMLAEFREHLGAIERDFDIKFWTDRHLAGGQTWNEEIQQTIADSQLFLVLVSRACRSSHYLLETELPAIGAQVREKHGLLIPVVLDQTDWRSIVGDLHACPTRARKTLPISQWPTREEGFDRARVEIAEAIRRHFHLIPRESAWVRVLLNQPQEDPGPFWTWRDHHFVLDQTENFADQDAAQDPLAGLLHEVIRARSRHFTEELRRWSNHLNPSLIDAVERLASAVDCRVDEIPARIWEIWEAETTLALEFDREKEAWPSGEPDERGLPGEVSRNLTSLLDATAPWLRLFPTARRLDDGRLGLLKGKPPLGPAEQLLWIAEDRAVIRTKDTRRLTDVFLSAQRGNPGAEKASAYASRAAQNLLIRCAATAAGHLMNQPTRRRSDVMDQLRRIDSLLVAAEPQIRQFQDAFPKDLADALTRLIGVSKQHIHGLERPTQAELEAGQELRAELAHAAGEMLSETAVRTLLAGSPAADNGTRINVDHLIQVDADGRPAFPAVQFEHGEVIPGIADIRDAAPDTDGWRLLQFLIGTPDGLAGRRPIDVLKHGNDRERGRVFALARALEA
jgi:hypothetical protein